MKALIYARCSTDESRQDVSIQLQELKNYCDKEGYEYDTLFDYSGGSKHIPDNLRKALELIKKGYYQIIVVHSLSRFSRLHPSTTNKIMDFITQECKCRFISLQENLDSQNDLTWFVVRHFFQYFSWLYSKNLSEKVKLGMAKAKEKGVVLGRKKGSRDRKPRTKKGYFLRYKKNPLKF